MTTRTYTPSNTVFLRALQGPVAEDEHLWVCSFAEDPSAEEPASRWFGRPLAADAVVELSSRRNNYFSTAVLKDGRRKRASFVRLMVLVADDADQTKLKAPPTWVLRTSRHKVQVGFAIRADDVDAFDWDTVGRALKAMHERGLVGADKSGNNAARYVRLPVGSNTKAAYGPPFAHELIEWRPEAVFTLAEALQALGVDPAVLAEPQKPAASVLDHLPAGITDELRDAVMRLDPDMGRDDWLHVGMALHHESGGDWNALALWDRWSAKGSKYKSAEDLEIRWDSFGRYTGKPRTGASVLQMARALPLTADDFEVEAPGSDTPSPDDAEGGPPVDDAKFDIVPAWQFAQGKPLSWLLKGLLPHADVGAVYGASGAGKSFLVLDIVAALARGLPWRGHRCKQAGVLYVAAEGASGVRNRLVAHAQHHGYPLTDLPVMLLGAAPNILDKTQVKDLVASIRARCAADTRLIVIDTLAQVTPGANENSAEDMGQALAHCRRIAEATGAMVLLVAHSGKDSDRGLRGWSGIKGALDVEILVERDGDWRAARITKMKDGTGEGNEYPFGLTSVHLGEDEDGDPITSAVVSETPEMGKKAPAVRGAKQQAVMSVLSELLEFDGEPPTRESVISAAVAMFEPPAKGKRDAREQDTKRALESLLEAGKVTDLGNGRVSLP